MAKKSDTNGQRGRVPDTKISGQPGAGGKDQQEAPDRTSQPPDIEAIHRDVDFANRYRLELNKTLLALAAALFAFTISFPPALTAIKHVWILGASWVCLAASLFGGLFNLYGWEKFYISYRDYAEDHEQDAGQKYRSKVTRWRRRAHGVQFGGFILGVCALAFFVVLNLANVKLADPAEAASLSSESGATEPDASQSGNDGPGVGVDGDHFPGSDEEQGTERPEDVAGPDGAGGADGAAAGNEDQDDSGEPGRSDGDCGQ